ncbi:MAG: hypothetical protein ACT4R6_04495 [Gemmatimonadaceae bacterium]
MSGLFATWRSEWQLRKRALGFLAALRREPLDDDVAWLAKATQGDLDRARWELRYARTALGVLVAQRDALDDRTGSLVAHEVIDGFRSDSRVAARMVKVAEQQFNERLLVYRSAASRRADEQEINVRIGDALLSVAGAASPNEADRARAHAIAVSYQNDANMALQEHFGLATLPPDVQPSLLGTKR